MFNGWVDQQNSLHTYSSEKNLLFSNLNSFRLEDTVFCRYLFGIIYVVVLKFLIVHNYTVVAMCIDMNSNFLQIQCDFR